MIRMLGAVAALSLASPGLAAPPASADRAALEQLAYRMDDAWNAADVEANADLFTIDATARFGDDPLGEGRDAIRRQFQSFFDGRPKGLRHVTRIDRIEQIAPNIAMWDAEIRVERQQDRTNWIPVTLIRNITLALRTRGGWRIKSVRAFPLAAAAAPAAP